MAYGDGGRANKEPMRDPEHPGAVMREWWLAESEPAEAAQQLGTSPDELRRVLDGRGRISPELAARLEAGGWSTAAFWLRLQAAYDAGLTRTQLGRAGQQLASMATKRLRAVQRDPKAS